jgi:hypothetical protein
LLQECDVTIISRGKLMTKKLFPRMLALAIPALAQLRSRGALVKHWKVTTDFTIEGAIWPIVLVAQTLVFAAQAPSCRRLADWDSSRTTKGGGFRSRLPRDSANRPAPRRVSVRPAVRASFQHSACSRPPPPITRIFIRLNPTNLHPTRALRLPVPAFRVAQARSELIRQALFRESF